MVFVWSQLARGDPTYTLVRVSLNDVVMVFAFAPIVALLRGLTDIDAMGDAAALARCSTSSSRSRPGCWCAGGSSRRAAIVGRGVQERARPAAILGLTAVPLLIQSYRIFAVAYGTARAWAMPFDVALPCAPIGTSNFFELAVAVAISLFGIGSGAALATVVGVLVEVPEMLSLVAFANPTRHWLPA